MALSKTCRLLLMLRDRETEPDLPYDLHGVVARYEDEDDPVWVKGWGYCVCVELTRATHPDPEVALLVAISNLLHDPRSRWLQSHLLLAGAPASELRMSGVEWVRTRKEDEAHVPWRYADSATLGG